MSDKPAGGSPPGSDPTGVSPTTRIERPPGTAAPARPSADDFQPDVPEAFGAHAKPSGPGPGNPPPAFEPPRESPIDAAIAAEDLQLIPGAMIADKRYRLLVFHGGPPHLQFWQALDTALNRQVALTFVDPDGQVQEILARTQRLSRIDLPGLARVLDVVSTGSGGLVVSEWIRGGSLTEVADTSPSPIGGARAIQSLAAAADAAHRSGVTLSVDHPSRIRVSIEGEVALAFPATMPDATPDEDIRGIGAALYALLVARWPLPEFGEPSGLAPADHDAAGQPLEPRAIDRDIPFQISAAASHAVQEGGGIRSAPTLLNLLQQATAIADRTEHIKRAEVAAPKTRYEGLLGSASQPESGLRQRRGLMIGLGVAAAVVIVAVIVLASVLGRIFGDVGDGLGGDELGLNAPSSAEGAAPGSVLKPVRATVFSPGGDADAPALAGLAIDGDPTTVWPTDTYSDAAPFPAFKNGVGLILQLSKPAAIGSVTIDVNSTGTAVQIRSSPTATPSKLGDTTALTKPTSLKPGTNTIEVDDASPTSNVLVWISTLGSVDGESRSDVAEITLKAAS